MSLLRNLNFYRSYNESNPNIFILTDFEFPLKLTNDVCVEVQTEDFSLYSNVDWKKETIKTLSEYSEVIRSAYIRWAISINALNVTKEYYKSKDDICLAINTIRILNDTPEKINMMVWNTNNASKNTFEIISMLTSYGIIDLYSILEDMIFNIFKIYYKYNPEELIKGNTQEQKKYRSIYKNIERCPEKWEEAFEKIITKWKKNTFGKGTSNIFKEYCAVANLNFNGHIDKDTLALTIKNISILRNSLIHSRTHVSKALESTSNSDLLWKFKFKEGEEIIMQLDHLSIFECFLDKFIYTLKDSLKH